MARSRRPGSAGWKARACGCPPDRGCPPTCELRLPGAFKSILPRSRLGSFGRFSPRRPPSRSRLGSFGRFSIGGWVRSIDLALGFRFPMLRLPCCGCDLFPEGRDVERRAGRRFGVWSLSAVVVGHLGSSRRGRHDVIGAIVVFPYTRGPSQGGKTEGSLRKAGNGTDQRNGVGFDQQDGSAVDGCMCCDMIGAHTPVARHAANSAESNRTRNLAWQSWARSGRPGVRTC